MAEPKKPNTKTMWIGDFRGVDVESFTVKDITGDDITRAAERCLPTNGQPIDGNLFNLLLRQQVIAGAIVEVDGVAVKGTCQASIGWNARTREFAGRTFDYVNGVSDKERELFEKALMKGDDAAPENTLVASTQPSLESGSGLAGT